MNSTKNEESTTKPMQRIYGQIVISLENCLLPDTKLEQTPSHLDGLDRETEIDLRILGCELIQTAGILLKLPQVAMATGQVLFQRFFYSKSFVRHNMETTAMSCVCLASKIEEAPRRIRDVINVFHHIKQVRAQKPITPMIIDINYITLKTQVIKAERRVLKELGFCVHVKHPHKLIVMYLQVLGLEKNQKVMQMAWNFMNDSLRTDVFVRYQPETIACACIYLTARKLSIVLPSNPHWYSVFSVSENHILDVCYRICQLYRRTKANVEKLEAAVEELRKRYMDSRKTRTVGQNSSPVQHSVDRSNGSAHNAWSGFISRAVPVPVEGNADEQKKSQSKSRTPSPSIEEKSRSRKKMKQNDRRSRSPLGKLSSSSSSKKKSRHSSRSPSSSPSLKHRKSDKKSDRSPIGSRDKYINGDKHGSGKDYISSKDYGKRDRDRRDRDGKDRSSKYDRYSSSSRDRLKHRARSKDVRR
uniref:Putative cdk9 kinase-activating protein cyclin t n=1 Tax=Lutzomyia longipalpis TaxID=7200 RepID=A0A1B0GLH9_LUTLO